MIINTREEKSKTQLASRTVIAELFMFFSSDNFLKTNLVSLSFP